MAAHEDASDDGLESTEAGEMRSRKSFGPSDDVMVQNTVLKNYLSMV